MNYSTYSEVKSILEFFNDVSFISLLNENTALIKNANTGDTWSLPFSGSGKDIVFHGEKAILEEKNPREEIEEEEILKNSFRSLLRKEANIDDLKETIIEAMSKCKSKKKKKDMMSEESESLVFPSKVFESLSEEESSFVIAFEEKWRNKVAATIAGIKEPLFACGNLFEDSGELKKKDMINPVEIIEAYAMKIEEKEIEFSAAENIFKWNESVKTMLGDKVKINPFTKSLDIDITKAIVESKKSGKELNNRETQKNLKTLHGELFESDALVNLGLGSDRVPGSHNGENKLSFLKFSGAFTNGDLEKLCDDFNYVLSAYNSLSQEDLKNIQDMKNKAEYMYRTNTIDDEEVAKIITAFNSSYGRDSRDKYRDPNFSSGNLDNQKTLSPEIRIPAVA